MEWGLRCETPGCRNVARGLDLIDHICAEASDVMSVEIVVFVVLDATRLKAMLFGRWCSYRVVSYIVFVELGEKSLTRNELDGCGMCCELAR
jgi:hypothetical protein